ncbi:hypothetical protein [Sediminicola luteus]|uniref:Uncharacterized protein n=1 Tax=Sediminicola luteus TaxID=319238 RepID=A0ABV2TTJ9_9FLAO
MRSIILTFLLSLWLSAIIAPSVMTLMDRDGKMMVIGNMNEEENQEQGKKEIGEKKLALYNYSLPNFLIPYNQISTSNNHDEHISSLNLDILLPPPKCLA